MQLSKLSKNTYHKCIKELHEAKYIYYHPSPSKFQAVRISVIRLDKEEPSPTRFKQLDLFDATEQLSSAGGGGTRYASDGGGEEEPGHNFKTDSVANLSQTSHNFKTDTVANLGHSYKPNISKQRETLPHQIFRKNDKIQKAINDIAAGVPNSVHLSPSGEPVPNLLREGGAVAPGEVIPSINEVQSFFQHHNHPADEAIKFFNHYQSLHWKLQGKTPILDWKPLVEKWMANAKKWGSPSGGGASQSRGRSEDQAKEIQYLYDSFLEGKNIFRHITTEHFNQLNLSLTDHIMQQAWKERINQVSGTNQHSLIELWKAYLTGDPNHQLVQKDKPHLIALAKRISVLNHFHYLQQSGSSLSPSGRGCKSDSNEFSKGGGQKPTINS